MCVRNHTHSHTHAHTQPPHAQLTSEILSLCLDVENWGKLAQASYIASSMRGQTAEARRTTILQPVEQKPRSQKDRQDEKAEGYVPDEGTS